ncbi:hypothetical protein D9M71_624130 [compost metagenome]
MDDIGCLGFKHHFFVGPRRLALVGGDKARAQVGKVGAQQLRGKDFLATVDAAGQQ